MKPKLTERHLAAMWSPPEKLPTEKSAGKPLLCVASTYTFNADFLESDLLPRFLGLKFDDTEGDRPFIIEREGALASCRVSILVDANQVDCSQTTLRWDQIPIFVPSGVQHAKVTLLVWESCIRLIVSSANITRSGYRKNREIAGVLDFFNHKDSTPRQVLYEAMDFLQSMTSWARADVVILDRLRKRLKDARACAGRWSLAPAQFSPRVARVSFLPGHPKRDGVAYSSVLKKAIELWGNSSADKITVLTPFLGHPDSDFTKLINTLRSIPLSREVSSALIVPRRIEIDADDKIPRIGLSRRFRDEWAKAWGISAEDMTIYGIPPLRQIAGEKIARILHAKAILIENKIKTMLLCGSSNFSAHGMGVGMFNIEANLVYTDSAMSSLGQISLADRLPVDRDVDLVCGAVWDDEGLKFDEDDDSANPRLPDVFQWATFRQIDAIITIGFNISKPFPSRWEIRVHGERQEKSYIILTRGSLGSHTEEKYEVHLPDDLKKVHLTNLLVIWSDDKNEEHTSRLLVHILKYDDLLPPSEFINMSVNSIIDYLISGKELADIADETGTAESKSPHANGLNQTPVQDTKDYLLYRMRRFGYALGILGERVLKVARNEDAITYRLMHDPLGPIQLANALITEFHNKEKIDNESEALLFALYELILVISHAGARCHAIREAGEPDFRIIFKKCVSALSEKVHLLKEVSQVDMRNVLEYGEKVLFTSGQLIGVEEK